MKKYLIPTVGVLLFTSFVAYATVQTNSRASFVADPNAANTASVIETVTESSTPIAFTAPTDSVAIAESVVKTAVPNPIVVLENQNTANTLGAVNTTENSKKAERKDERKKFTDNIHYENEDDDGGEDEGSDD